MVLYRLAREKFALPLSGVGASLHGGRWNAVGTELIYTATSRALAMVEVLVHLEKSELPDDLRMLTLFVPDKFLAQPVEVEQLPLGWSGPVWLKGPQSIGDRFARVRKHLLLQVPSSIVRGDWNMLINPHHPSFDEVQVVENELFRLDKRLVE